MRRGAASTRARSPHGAPRSPGAPSGGARAGVRGHERGQHARGALAQLPLREVVFEHGRQRARAARRQQAAGRARRARPPRRPRLPPHRRRRRLRRQPTLTLYPWCFHGRPTARVPVSVTGPAQVPRSMPARAHDRWQAHVCASAGGGVAAGRKQQARGAGAGPRCGTPQHDPALSGARPYVHRTAP